MHAAFPARGHSDGEEKFDPDENLPLYPKEEELGRSAQLEKSR